MSRNHGHQHEYRNGWGGNDAPYDHVVHGMSADVSTGPGMYGPGMYGKRREK